MEWLWWVVLAGSACLLAVTLMRNRVSRQWLGYLALNVVLAAFILYFINMFGARIPFHIPINVPTVATVGILGIPGIMLLVVLKLTLV